MAVCNEKYRLFLIDIGAYDHEGEKQVYTTFEILKSLEDGSMDLPACPTQLPFFPLKTFMMEPYPGRGLITGNNMPKSIS
jgi:hypothetical protein